ncbi:MAG: Do family serine endopeptidase [Rhodocyclaceae bacterium]|jgi:serine protease DegQ|nr:Do family serine endopeptidase [Rhodocyclaceae bacterium]
MFLKRLWLIFAQTVTVSVAALFVVQTLKPEWLAWRPVTVIGRPQVVAIQQAAEGETHAVVSYAEAARAALPAVVHIFTSQEIRQPPFIDDPLFRRFFGDRFGGEPQRQSGLGSGVVVSADGLVLTNNHVVESADAIEVALADGRKFEARLVGADPESDLAVLKITTDKPLTPIIFAPPNTLRVGDVVLAIGNPFGVGQTVTHGIVSALGRTHLGINTFEDFIQTDAAINPGNSGGALVDSNGNLVGINTAIYSQSGGSMGIGFAIPVSLAKNVMEQIIKTGTVTRGWIGVEVQDMTAELAESFGVKSEEGALIAGVMRNGPADKAGVRPGDILVSVAGKPVKDAQVMLELIAALPPGEKARFGLLREGKPIDVEITIGKRPRPPRQ